MTKVLNIPIGPFTRKNPPTATAPSLWGFVSSFPFSPLFFYSREKAALDHNLAGMKYTAVVGM